MIAGVTTLVGHSTVRVYSPNSQRVVVILVHTHCNRIIVETTLYRCMGSKDTIMK